MVLSLSFPHDYDSVWNYLGRLLVVGNVLTLTTGMAKIRISQKTTPRTSGSSATERSQRVVVRRYDMAAVVQLACIDIISAKSFARLNRVLVPFCFDTTHASILLRQVRETGYPKHP